MTPKAIIFDLNGTVLKDEEVYCEAFGAVLRRIGVERECIHERGIGVKENWVRFEKVFKFETELALGQLADETQKEYLKRLDKVKVRSGFRKLVDGLRKTEGIKIGLATSNDAKMVEKVLHHHNLNRYFDVVVTSDEVTKNKPDPQIFLKTAKNLKVSPQECLVFEDSDAGLIAAKKAGMRAVRIADGGTHRSMYTDHVIKDFDKIRLFLKA